MENFNFTFLAFGLYLAFMLAIGFYFSKKNKNLGEYFLGGRQLGSWVTAMSAQASDMSGWLLMGLPAAAYFSGIGGGLWIAIGLAIGTYLNWLLIAKRLRKFSEVSGNAITIPEYLQNRFLSKTKYLGVISALVIAVFFLVYTASAFTAGAKLFQNVFKIDYRLALTIGALVIIIYTFLGGFSAVCWTDFFQGILMFGAIIIVPIVAMFNTPDFSFEMLNTVKDGVLLNPFKTTGGTIPITVIISGLAWGFGYFGMPHILTRFMAIKSSNLIKKSRIIAMVWVIISLFAALCVGVIGYVYLTSQGVSYPTEAASEAVFMDLIGKLIPGFIGGIFLSAILAAVMSTADSQLLVTASSISNDIYKSVVRKNASDKELMTVSRISVILISIIAYIMAFNPDNSVMNLVSYAWAGLGSAFGPVIILSLFWKRMTSKGAAAGMITGGLVVVLWKNIPFLSGTGLFEIIPGFILAFALIIIVSKLDKAPSKEVEVLFDKAQSVEI